MTIPPSIISPFYQDQFQAWPELYDLHQGLSMQANKVIHVKTNVFHLHFVPHRIQSTKGSYATKQVGSPLDIENLATKQKSYSLIDGYDFLVNPFPIFPLHAIICSRPAKKQMLYSYITDLRRIAKEVGTEFVLLYNGTKCGASIPEHWHVHVLPKKLFDPWFNSTRKSGPFDDGLRKAYIVHENEELPDKQHEDAFINSAIGYDISGRIRQYFFLRKAHRHRYFPTNPEQPNNSDLLISPGVVDVLGHISCVREDELKTLTEQTITQIFEDIFI